MLFKALQEFVASLVYTVRAGGHSFDLEGLRVVIYFPDKDTKGYTLACLKESIPFAITMKDKLGSSHSDAQMMGVPIDFRVTHPEHVVQHGWDD